MFEPGDEHGGGRLKGRRASRMTKPLNIRLANENPWHSDQSLRGLAKAGPANDLMGFRLPVRSEPPSRKVVN